MINIQKYYSVHISLIRSMLVHSVHFGSIWSTLVLFGPICPLGPIQLTLVLFGPLWSYSVLFVPTRFTLVHSILFSLLWSYSVLLVLIRSYFVHLVHFVPFGPFVFTLVHLDQFDSFWSTSVHFCTLACRGKDMFRLRVPILNPKIYIYISIL